MLLSSVLKWWGVCCDEAMDLLIDSFLTDVLLLFLDMRSRV
jgi:hypothetical protein